MLTVECGCGCSYTVEQFRTLPFKGMMEMKDGREPCKLELRNCICGSTHSIWIDKDGNPTEENLNEAEES